MLTLVWLLRGCVCSLCCNAVLLVAGHASGQLPLPCLEPAALIHTYAMQVLLVAGHASGALRIWELKSQLGGAQDDFSVPFCLCKSYIHRKNKVHLLP